MDKAADGEHDDDAWNTSEAEELQAQLTLEAIQNQSMRKRTLKAARIPLPESSSDDLASSVRASDHGHSDSSLEDKEQGKYDLRHKTTLKTSYNEQEKYSDSSPLSMPRVVSDADSISDATHPLDQFSSDDDSELHFSSEAEAVDDYVASVEEEEEEPTAEDYAILDDKDYGVCTAVSTRFYV